MSFCNGTDFTGSCLQPESDGSRSGSSLSLRNISGQPTVGTPQPTAQSPSHRGVHRSSSATNAKPTSRRASSGGRCKNSDDCKFEYIGQTVGTLNAKFNYNIFAIMFVLHYYSCHCLSHPNFHILVLSFIILPLNVEGGR